MARAILDHQILVEQADNDLWESGSRTVTIYETDGTTLFAGTMYNAASGGSVVTNPVSTSASGLLEVWTDATNARRVKLSIAGLAGQRNSAFRIDEATAVTTDTAQTVTAVKTFNPGPVIYLPKFREGQWFTPEAFPQSGVAGTTLYAPYKPVPNQYTGGGSGPLQDQELAWPDASIAVNAAIEAAKDYGGNVRFGAGGYWMDSPVNMDDVTQIEVSGLSGVTSSAPDVYGSHIIYRNTANNRNAIWWSMVGATYCHLSHLNIHHHFGQWDRPAGPTDKCKAGIFIAGQYNPTTLLGLESANNVLDRVIVNAPAKIGAVAMHGTALNRMQKCQIYNISDGLGALVLSAANGGTAANPDGGFYNYDRLQTARVSATFSVNVGNAGVPSFVAEHCEFHAFYQGANGLSGHDTQCVSIYLDGVLEAAFKHCDCVATYYNVRINDEQPGTRLTRTVTFEDCALGGSTYGPFLVSSASTVKDLVIDGNRGTPVVLDAPSPQPAIITTNGNVTFDGLKVRRIKAVDGGSLSGTFTSQPSGTGGVKIPMFRMAGTDTAVRMANCEIEFDEMDAIIDGSVNSSNVWLRKGTITKTNGAATHTPLDYAANGTLTLDSVAVRTGITTKTPLSAAASGALTLTTSMANVTGCAVSLAVGIWMVTGDFDFIEKDAGDVGSILEGQLVVASGSATIALSTSHPFFRPNTQDDRAMVSKTWKVTVTATASLQLQAKKGSGTGTSEAGATHTTISASYVSAS